jgi:hypothetical protein
MREGKLEAVLAELRAAKSGARPDETEVVMHMDWCPVALHFVADKAAVERLIAQGVPRQAIWTTKELLHLVRIPGMTVTEARRRALARLEGGGVRERVAGAAKRQGARA